MKRQIKKILLIAAVALAILVLAAGLIMLLRKDSFGDNYFTRNKAIATVNGAKITKNEFAASLSNYYNNIDTYNMYAMYYGYGKYYDVNSETGVRDLKKDILNSTRSWRPPSPPAPRTRRPTPPPCWPTTSPTSASTRRPS